MFIDLSGFTWLSERLGLDPIRELMKDFHALVDREAASAGGVITNFLGDGAMILFELPQATSDDAAKATQPFGIARCLALANQSKFVTRVRVVQAPNNL